MKCNNCGKFIKLNVEEIRAGVKDAKTWVMVEKEEDATNDPGWIGEDHSMLMLQYVNEEYGCSSFTCHTPKADEEANRKWKEEQEELQRERSKNRHTGAFGSGPTVAVLGGGRMGRQVALALAAQQITCFAEPAEDIGTLYEDLARLNAPAPKHDWKVARDQGFKPNHRQMRAMNKQAGRRGGRRR